MFPVNYGVSVSQKILSSIFEPLLVYNHHEAIFTLNFYYMIMIYVFIYVLLGKQLQRYSEAFTWAAPGENSQKNISWII